MFQRQRHAYEAQAPAFDATVQAAMARHVPSPSVAWARAGAALAAAVALLLMARPLLRRPPAPFTAHPVASVASRWNSPRESADLPWRSSILVSDWQGPSDCLSESAPARPLSLEIN